MLPDRVATAITDFLATCQAPALLEPGQAPLALDKERLRFEITPQGAWMEAWDGNRYWSRRIVQAGVPSRKRLDLESSRFGKRHLTVSLIDTADARTQPAIDKSHRSTLTGQFRSFLSRNFCGWDCEAFRAEAKLEHSFSPLYPSALLKRGEESIAAIAAPDRDTSFHVLTFALIWLEHVRARRLLLYLPKEHSRAAVLLARHLNPQRVQTEIWLYDGNGIEAPLDARDFGNLQSSLLPRYSRLAGPAWWLDLLSRHPEIDAIEEPDGSLSFRIRGLAFARLRPSFGNELPKLTFGLRRKVLATEKQLPAIEALIAEINTFRCAASPDRRNPFYFSEPERWLESQVRANIGELDAATLPAPLYGQALGSLQGERGAIDLLGIDQAGRLQIFELKTTEDIHLPLQAFDYWLRIRHHQQHQDFANSGYFTSERISSLPPKVFLVSPCLHFHPMSETVLKYLPRECETVRLGLNSDWRQRLDVVLRM
jgi:hypothetical protein